MRESSCAFLDKAYLAIIITILPLWVILTTLIVFILLSFHKSLRSTKIYDNCTRNTAQHPYYVEIRTGDTSATYARRRTTLTIDMFDDNQTTLARIAVPGHVIFGKRDAPVPVIDDEKFPELRITRFWLHRASRLKRIATIRLTHTCLEPEARIMVYGVAIRTNEPERHKLFFPVLSYITAYGAAPKPNAGFDLDPLGTISAMGGSQAETSPLSDHLTWVDYTILTYLVVAIIFYTTAQQMISREIADTVVSAYMGAVVGALSYTIVLIVGLLFRYVIKTNYALRIGMGFWAISYYLTCTLLVIVSTVLWILTTVISYKHLCPDQYGNWILALGIALIETLTFASINSFVIWMIQFVSPKYAEQYLVPDDPLYPDQQQSKGRSRSQQQQQQPHQQHQQPHPQQQLTQQSYQYMAAGGKQQQMIPSGAGFIPAPAQTHPPPGWQVSPGNISMQMGQSAAQPYHPTNLYGQPMMLGPAPTYAGGYKQSMAPGGPYALTYEPPQQATAQAAPAPVQQAQQQQQQQQQLPTLSANKGPKKLGSNESTGSTYYQQLMKNKGGVKSISQYGELLRQKKVSKAHPPK